MENIKTYFGLFSKYTVVEMATCAGLPMFEDRKNPLITSTYGVGQLILEAANTGLKKTVLAIGGSATNDGGCGAAAACGVKFYNQKDEIFIPVGQTLKDIARIDTSSLNDRLLDIEISVLCDVNNPMHGPKGAAYVFAPQKGASAKEVILLDDGLKHLDKIIKRDLCLEVATIPGSGAAGALGAGMLAFFNAKLVAGIDTILDLFNFDNYLKDCDYVFTGEGSFDSQSLEGKVISGLAKRTKKANIPLIILTGAANQIPQAYQMGVTAVLSINRFAKNLSLDKQENINNLRFTMDNICSLLKTK